MTTCTTQVKFTSVQTSPHQASGHTLQPTSGTIRPRLTLLSKARDLSRSPSLSQYIQCTYKTARAYVNIIFCDVIMQTNTHIHVRIPTLRSHVRRSTFGQLAAGHSPSALPSDS